MRTINDWINVIRELAELEQGGVVLPYPRGFILRLEFAGHTVDLDTGKITIGGASVRYLPTLAGAEAVGNAN